MTRFYVCDVSVAVYTFGKNDKYYKNVPKVKSDIYVIKKA